MSKFINVDFLNYQAKKHSQEMIYYILRNTEILLNEDYTAITFDSFQKAEKWCEEMNDLKPGDNKVFYQPIGVLKKIIIT